MGFRQSCRAAKSWTRMYGPPHDCKRSRGREGKSAQIYSAFGWRSILLAMMSCARVCPYKSVGCSFETILVFQAEDCAELIDYVPKWE